VKVMGFWWAAWIWLDRGYRAKTRSNIVVGNHFLQVTVNLLFEDVLFLNYIGNVSIKQSLFGKIESKRQIASEGIRVK
jgi:hypothetical protein